jgi:hypothetical protein
MGIRWIEYEGVSILYMDYRSCKSKEETIKMLEEAADIFRTSDKDILSLDNYEGGYASGEFMDRAKQLADVFSAKRKKGAAVGVHGLKNMLLRTYNIFAKDKIMPFSTEEEALKYLTSNSD